MKPEKLRKNPDVIVSSLLLLAVVIIVGSWLWAGITWLWNWFAATSQTPGSAWSEIWAFCKRNLSILVVIYGIISLQASGVAELRFEKSFLKALVLALVLTPPVMMAVYGRKRKATNSLGRS